jgi:hypothetical protein
MGLVQGLQHLYSLSRRRLAFDAILLFTPSPPCPLLSSHIQDDVYDITDFIEQHPGGASKIQLAAGAAIDPYWALYQQHNNVEVKNILSRFRIGKLKRPAGEAAPVDAKVCVHLQTLKTFQTFLLSIPLSTNR